MMSWKFPAAGGAAALAAVLAVTSPADAAGVKVGVLTCHVSSGWGFIFGSSKDLRCNFAGNRFGERYVGSINKFGVDIGYTAGGVLVWDVFAPTSGMRRGALSGSYAGATASATVGLGVGANALVGGSDRSIALQPLSIEGNSGLNVAAGIGSITLHYVGPEGPMGPPPGAMRGPPPPPPGQ
ncbi:MAG TPA: DUF992 domain-containing protein [Rhizomicrobium sp.]|jgi:hypothetical protein|nr:DUF992 domain-containing protein [Rhizomicrobium sp.]